MSRIQLDDTTRTELRRLRHTDLSDTARDRLEMVLLSDAGWSPPRIARHRGFRFSPRTTECYDRSSDEVKQDEIEKMQI